jgi:hypothetical protein
MRRVAALQWLGQKMRYRSKPHIDARHGPDTFRIKRIIGSRRNPSGSSGTAPCSGGHLSETIRGGPHSSNGGNRTVTSDTLFHALLRDPVFLPALLYSKQACAVLDRTAAHRTIIDRSLRSCGWDPVTKSTQDNFIIRLASR